MVLPWKFRVVVCIRTFRDAYVATQVQISSAGTKVNILVFARKVSHLQGVTFEITEKKSEVAFCFLAVMNWSDGSTSWLVLYGRRPLRARYASGKNFELLRILELTCSSRPLRIKFEVIPPIQSFDTTTKPEYIVFLTYSHYHHLSLDTVRMKTGGYLIC